MYKGSVSFGASVEKYASTLILFIHVSMSMCMTHIWCRTQLL